MAKIRVVIPNAGMTSATLARRERMLATVARQGTLISVCCIEGGPRSIESARDAVIAGPYILAEVSKAQAEGYDAIIVYCMSDPGIDAAREITTIPVIAPGETCLHVAAMLASRLAFLTVLEQLEPQVSALVRRSRIDPSCLVSIRSVQMPVAQLCEDPDQTLRAVVQEARAAIDQDGAEALILGCLGFAGLGERVQREVRVPVIDPAFVSLLVAELLVHAKLAHSKSAYPSPVETAD